MKKIKVIFFVFFLSCLSFSSFASENINTDFPQNDEIALGDTLLNIQDNLSQNSNSPTQKNLDYINKTGSLNLKEVFLASPLIYSILLVMSMMSCVILLYTLVSFRPRDLMNKNTVDDLKKFLLNENMDEALVYCENKRNLISTMIASGIYTREHGVQYMLETIKSEGKRATSIFWHRISILNDIVVIAPMLGLLGTVIGMFYAFYDINRSVDSLSALFDGLGIAVGTTVAGLIVALIAMTFYSFLKFRMIKTLNMVENEAISLGNLIKTKE